ncbi:MAG: glycosyl hydrolase family 57 [Desulfobacterota bacterium]|nr:glycosyl hydrolase family 57 [Thermodesulfobacteriota bacterium]
MADIYIPNDIPPLGGLERDIDRIVRNRPACLYLPESPLDFHRIQSAAAIALHMHQPLIPAGGPDLSTAPVISNLQYMMEHQHIGDNHNAPVFHWCYKRMGEFIPQLLNEGNEPRVMLEYSGTLLYGLQHMGLNDVIHALTSITCSREYRRCVEWLGCTWGHAVAPSTPVQDFRLHVRAWQHHFLSLFGVEALQRVKGFSPAEMALPNHPEVAYAFVKTLKECGYQWVLVQEHTIEQPDNGSPPQLKHIPHRLVCRNAAGECASIIAIIKTQGSDTKLVGQMQPYYEARTLSRRDLAGKTIPPLVTQIADGENGGVMMNEFPGKFFEVVREARGSATTLLNVSEYLEYLFSLGITENDFPVVQPMHQKKIWDRFTPGDSVEHMEHVITELHRSDPQFHMEGGSWTNNISWVRGYENILGTMLEASALFHEHITCKGISPDEPRYHRALFYLLASQTSCYRYWGQGQWTDYGREMCRRAKHIILSMSP